MHHYDFMKHIVMLSFNSSARTMSRPSVYLFFTTFIFLCIADFDGGYQFTVCSLWDFAFSCAVGYLSMLIILRFSISLIYFVRFCGLRILWWLYITHVCWSFEPLLLRCATWMNFSIKKSTVIISKMASFDAKILFQNWTASLSIGDAIRKILKWTPKILDRQLYWAV